MNVSLSTRLIVRAGIPAALLFVLVMWLASQRSFRRVLEQTERSSRLAARQHAAQINSVLSPPVKIAEMVAMQLESGEFDTAEKVERFLRQVVQHNHDIYGSCIAFEPNSFDPAKRYYAPYYYWMDGEPQFVQLGNPDYDYFKWEWYRVPKTTEHARWSEPYFDEGGGNAIMTTYSVPFRRDGKVWGIATVDISISQLMAQAGRIDAGKGSYAFMVSRQGRFLTHPDKSKIMRSTVQEANAELGRVMTSGADGFLRTREPATGREAWVAFVPVPSGDLSLGIVYPLTVLMADALHLQVELLTLGILGLLVMSVALIFIARSISRPITELAGAAQEVAAGRLDVRLEPRAPVAEVRNLTHAFNKMTRDLQMRMQELRYTTTIKERLEGELQAARSIQMSLLPKTFPAFPERTDFDIHAIVRPAREVGGDFYDFYFIDEDRLCALIGDVSGKGIPAALFMAVTKTLFKANASPTCSPAETLARVNRELCNESEAGMFVTLLYVFLDIRTGELQLCNAGHHPPLLISVRGEVTALSGQAGMALGLLPDIEYPVLSRQMQPGDTLFLFTDGVTEAVNENREFFSNERLHAAVAATHREPVHGITRRVIQEVRGFSAERDQTDDISVLALRWLGAAPPAAQRWAPANSTDLTAEVV